MTAPSPILAAHALPPSPQPWPTLDPFLFCVHHHDAYPRGNGQLGPAASLTGRQLGQDFAGKDGWSMYHGESVPGFPSHPHRGFETVTIARQGLIDHADSLGAAARFGHGDVQWLTAGRGIVHSEMFPLLDTTGDNPAELFQIWLNLPARLKMSPPHFTMLWGDTVPSYTADAPSAGGAAKTLVRVIAGSLVVPAAEGAAHSHTHLITPPAPPPDSWASQADSDVAIWTLVMAPGAQWTLPPAAGASTRRMLYIFRNGGLSIAGQRIEGDPRAGLELAGDAAVSLVNQGDTTTECLLLQGRPIAEPVASHGPFVMNSREEIEQTFRDYHATGFGGWPWDDGAPTHGQAPHRFARHADGRLEEPVARPPDPR